MLMFLMNYIHIEKHKSQCLRCEGQQRSQPHVTVIIIKQMFRHQTICTFMNQNQNQKCFIRPRYYIHFSYNVFGIQVVRETLLKVSK